MGEFDVRVQGSSTLVLIRRYNSGGPWEDVAVFERGVSKAQIDQILGRLNEVR